MIINFILPGFPQRPVGGFRVVYEYASRFVKKGHTVYVTHPSIMKNIHTNLSLIKKIRKRVVHLYLKLVKPKIKWLPVDPGIKLLYVREPVASSVPDADVVFATAWQTSEYIKDYPGNKGRKYYLVMDFDPWFATKEELLHSWSLPFRKIAICHWLADKVREYGGRDVVGISLGIDQRRFCLLKEVKGRKMTISMMYSIAEYKDLDTGITALNLCRKKHPDIDVVFFGPMRKRPEVVPSWARYLGTLSDSDLIRLYNESSIFVSSSIEEGFAFPPAEAMACGCAVACTDCGGNRDYTRDGVNSLVSEPRDVTTLANNINRLIEDEKLRTAIATKGKKDISSFTWEKSADLLEKEMEI
ncbi:glycosyltransferase family 4 protein [bacterium]|nr:glycosyltransferase family 4 protein [bacterium]